MARTARRRPTLVHTCFACWAALLCVIGVTAACANTQSGDDAANDPPSASAETLTGSYLAARHARSRHDEAAASDFFLAALAKSPDDPVLLTRAYGPLILDGRVAEGNALARQVAALNPQAIMAQIAVAADDLHEGRLAEVEARLASLPKAAITPVLIPGLRAWTLFELGRSEEALAQLSAMAEVKDFKPVYHLHAALMNEALGQAIAAADHGREAVAFAHIHSLRLVQLIGGLEERAGRRNEAKELYQRYNVQHPGSAVLDDAIKRVTTAAPPPGREISSAAEGAAEVFLEAATHLARQAAPESALVLAQLGLYLRPNFPVLQHLIADLMESFERYSDANRVYESIEASSPLAWQARLGIAQNLNKLDRFDEAKTRLLGMAAERPNDPQPLIDLADMLRARERFEEAVAIYDMAVARIASLEPRHWRLLYARGIALERSELWSRAETDFLKALEFEPDQPFVLNYLGYSWVEQGLNLDEAVAMIRKAVELRPSDGYIVDSLGWGLYQLGRFDEAVIHLERAVELRPQDPVINDHLGDAYWAVGRQREARFQWRAALGLAPEPDLRAEIESKLKRGPLREANALPR